MRPDARLQSAIDILDTWLDGNTGLDRVLVQWARNNRYAGSGDRARIADLVYDAARRLRSAHWVVGREASFDGRAALLGTSILNDAPLDALFSGERHAPEPLSEAERSAVRSLESAPRAVRLDYPDWLEPHVAQIDDADLAALRDRAPLDLRVNTLKSDAQAALFALAEDDIIAHRLDTPTTALRVTAGERKVARSRAYLNGLVEIQDAGSQHLADLACPDLGDVIIDLCAGGGGKALAIAAASDNRARILAHDISEARLAALPDRAQRAGARIECITTPDLQDWHGRANLVFVDAPCSGSGAWRRNPDAKWRLTATRLQNLCEIQTDLLHQAARLCAPDGRIVYGTCSLFDAENADQITAFTATNSHWRIQEQHTFRPSQGTDGFFGAVLTQH